MTDEPVMPASTQAPREYRAIVPMEGYVHKFRLEALEEAVTRTPQLEVSTPTVSLGPLLAKFALTALALAGIGAAGARVLI